MMNKILLLFSVFVAGQILPAAAQAVLYRNDRLLTRDEVKPLRPEWAPFYHGVASGDPLDDRVIIWTRITPELPDQSAIEVRWTLAADPGLTEVVATGTALAGPSADFTVKVDVTGLLPGTTYYYGFNAMGRNSLTGRTRTTPRGDQAGHLKFGVVSCSNFQAGYFNAYQRLAERNDLDAIIHLGDYIYEYGDGEYGELAGERPLAPASELLSLEDYRTRYSTYRLDTSLIRIHQQHPFITVWDDHESANDAFRDGAQNHDPDTEGEWATRLANAQRAYFEWMPIRGNASRQVYRRISYGNLMDLLMLDTRIEGREQQINDPFDPARTDPGRTLLGADQKSWLLGQLAGSGARWKILGQQVIFAPLETGWAAALDQDPSTDYALAQGLAQDVWNGYPAERQQLIDFIRDNAIDDVVILTGDFHTSVAFDVTDRPSDTTFQDLPGFGLTPFYRPSDSYDPLTGEGSVLVEFATPSITSANFDENFGPTLSFFIQQLINRSIRLPGGPEIGNPNPHLKYADLTRHGYFILDVKPDSVQANWYFSDILKITGQETFAAAWYARSGDPRLRMAPAASAPKAVQETPAPADPPAASGPTATGERAAPAPVLTLLSIYPNPFDQHSSLHYAVNRPATVQVALYNQAGQLVRQMLDRELPPGLYTLELDARELPPGAYFYRIRADAEVVTAKVLLAR